MENLVRLLVQKSGSSMQEEDLAMSSKFLRGLRAPAISSDRGSFSAPSADTEEFSATLSHASTVDEDQECSAFAAAALHVISESGEDTGGSSVPVSFSLQVCTGLCGVTIHCLLQQLSSFNQPFTPHGCRQLLADVEFLSDLMDGLSVHSDVRQPLLSLLALLDCASNDFWSVAGSQKGLSEQM